MTWEINFLGVSNGCKLGTSSAVLSLNKEPQLLIDCGAGTLQRYLAQYHALPKAIYITHLHMDHIGDLEALFYRACFTERKEAIKVFVAASIVAQLTQRIGHYTGQLAEGGINFWDVLQVVPSIDGFWWKNHYFYFYATRHHTPQTSFALHLPGHFLYTGDTRPIPEIIHHYCSQGETIFHDCTVNGNPSHSSAKELLLEYRSDVIDRLVAYHYSSAHDRRVIENMGLRTAKAGEALTLPLDIKSGTGKGSLQAIG